MGTFKKFYKWRYSLSEIEKEYILYIPDYNRYVTGISDKYVLMRSNKDEALRFCSEDKARDFISKNNLKAEDYRVVSLNNSFQLIVNLFLITTIITLSFVENEPAYYFIAKVLYNILIFVTIVFNACCLKE